MLTTIEQKLSAIKAINQEKDQVQECVSTLATFPKFASLRSGSYEVPIPEYLVPAVLKMVTQAYEDRRMELISDAEQLMK